MQFCDFFGVSLFLKKINLFNSWIFSLNFCLPNFQSILKLIFNLKPIRVYNLSNAFVFHVRWSLSRSIAEIWLGRKNKLGLLLSEPSTGVKHNHCLSDLSSRFIYLCLLGHVRSYAPFFTIFHFLIFKDFCISRYVTLPPTPMKVHVTSLRVTELFNTKSV